MHALKERADELRRLVKTDPDPRVRRRAQALFMLAEGAAVLEVARWVRTAPHRVRARHDLRHRQDRGAVAATKEVLAWLGKAPAPGSFTWSTLMNARSTVTPGWRRSGAGAAVS
jgi:hypothetical protein